MKYSIQEAARITGLTASTLRYYESEGLLPNIKRLKIDIDIMMSQI